MEMTKQMEIAVKAMNDALDGMGLAPGCEIYVIRDACFECPDKDDHCTVGCDRKVCRYMEKTSVFRTKVEYTEDGSFDICVIDSEGESHMGNDHGKTLFTDRQDAIRALL